MLKVTMLIPVFDNQGHTIDDSLLDDCCNQILNLCGGYTRMPPVFQGTWQDRASSKVYHDTLYSVMVACEPQHLEELQQIAAEIASICKQECLYFEYHEVNIDFITPTKEN